MKEHSRVGLITSSSSEIYTVISTMYCSNNIHTFLGQVAEFFGIDVNPDDYKVEVMLDQAFVTRCQQVLERERERGEEYGYLQSRPPEYEDRPDVDWIRDDPWELFYLMHYSEDVGEPYAVKITNMKTKRELSLNEMYAVFDAVRSGEG